MKFLFVLIFFASLNLIGRAEQEIIIINERGKPIEGVLIFNLEENKQVLSDKDGVANISIFDENEIIIFQHPSFEFFSSKPADLSGTNYQVILQDKVVSLDEVLISANRWSQKT